MKPECERKREAEWMNENKKKFAKGRKKKFHTCIHISELRLK